MDTNKKELVTNNIVIEDAHIGFRNFSGEEGKFNAKGQRNFCVFLEFDMGKTLEEDGWNVRWLDPREEEDEKKPYLQVKVSYENIPPQIVLVTSKGKSILDEGTISMLDWADIQKVDLIIRPYNWEVSGKTGVKAYVKAMYVTIVEDVFEAKYRNAPDSALTCKVRDKDGNCIEYGD